MVWVILLSQERIGYILRTQNVGVGKRIVCVVLLRNVIILFPAILCRSLEDGGEYVCMCTSGSNVNDDDECKADMLPQFRHSVRHMPEF